MKKKIFLIIGCVFLSICIFLISIHIFLIFLSSLELKNVFAELEEKRIPLTIKQIRPSPVPDGENAAIDLNKAFILMTSSDPKKQFIANLQSGDWNDTIDIVEKIFSSSDTPFLKICNLSDSERKELSESVIKSIEVTEIIKALEIAAVKPSYNFNLKYEEGFAIFTPHLSLFHKAIDLLCTKATLEIDKGDAESACNTLITAIKISKHLRNEPILISNVVMLKCLHKITDCINTIIDKYGIPNKTAEPLLSEIIKINLSKYLKGTLRGEFVIMNLFCDSFLKGEFLKENRDISQIDLILYYPRLKRDYAFSMKTMSQLIDFNDEHIWDIYSKARAMEIDFPKEFIFPNIFLPALVLAYRKNSEAMTNIAICKLKLALNIYKNNKGKYPENLSLLKPDILNEIPIDYITGTSLIYKTDTDNYSIYSESLENSKKKKAGNFHSSPLIFK